MEPLEWLLQRSPSIFAIVLECWALAEDTHRAEMAEHLARCGVSLATHPTPLAMTRTWAATEANRIIQQFTDRHPDIPETLACAMACYLTNQFPCAERKREQESLSTMDLPITAPHFSEWLEKLRSLPATDPSWGEIEFFIRAVEEVTASKRQQLQSRQAVQTAIEEFRTNFASLITFFEFTRLMTLSAGDFADEHLSGGVKVMEELAGLFRSFQSIKDQPCSTRTEYLAHRERLDAVDRSIHDVYSQLSALIRQPDTMPEPTATEPQAAVDEAETVDAGAFEETAADAGDSQPPGDEFQTSEIVAAEPAPPADAPVDAGSSNNESNRDVSTSETAAPAPDESPVAGAPALDGEVGITTTHGDTASAGGTETVTAEARAPESGATAIAVSKLSEAEALLVNSLEADDLRLAYWIARSQAARGEQPLIPASLAGILVGSRLIESPDDRIIEDMRELVIDYQLSELSHPILEVAAALRPALLAPSLEIRSWVKPPVHLPAVHRLAEKVFAFSDTKLGFTREDLDIIVRSRANQRNCAAARRAIEEWLETAPRRDSGYQPASEAWHRLCGPNGALHGLATRALNNGGSPELRKELDKWKDTQYVNGLVERRIEGRNRQAILRNIEDAVNMLLTYCDAAGAAAEISAVSDWRRKQLVEFQTALPDLLDQARSELRAVIDGSTFSLERGEFRCLLSSIESLAELLGLDGEMPGEQINRRWRGGGEQTLQSVLAERLIHYPDLDIGPDGEPADVGQVAPVIVTASAESRATPAKAIEGWIRRQDYRFIPLLLERVAEANRETLRHRYEASIRNSRAELVERLSAVRRRIEQYYLENILEEKERNACDQELAGIEPASTVCFPASYARIETVSALLDVAKAEKIAHLRQEWTAIQSQLAASGSDDTTRQQVDLFVQRQLEETNIRVVQEKLSQIRDAMDPKGALEDLVSTAAASPDYLESFLASHEELESALSNQALRLFPTMDDSAQQAARAWTEMRRGGENSEEIVSHLQTVLQFLGFDVTATPAFTLQHRSREWVHFSVVKPPTRAQLKPFWQFGSTATGLQIVCTWDERRGSTGVVKFLEEHHLLHSAVIVLYFGKLSRQQRRLRVEPSAPVAVLDEVLLLFLMRQADDRLPAFLRSSLPFSAVDPYIDFGNIPPEMFYGRTSMVDELLRRGGSCLVYGGRQLGKSALLQEVCRRFDSPALDQYAWVREAPKKGKPTTQVWRDLLAGHQHKRLLPATLSTAKPELVEKHILDMFSDQPNRRVMVLLDEADEFLEADAESGFEQVKSLRELVTRTDSRFRIVFAGIHHVQRFQGIPNQPLAQFGLPVCVGPLEPKPAFDLVVEPLHATGIRFTDSSVPLFVLSYTNYHTGLIQSFCKEIIRYVHTRRPATGPPYTISADDVETIYHRGAKLRDLLRERFELTIRVDERYRAITWAMVQKQLAQRDSYSLSFSTEEIRDMAGYWWPQVFKNLPEEELRGLLIEMGGLGILSRTREGKYRLRSPNLIPMLGSENDIAESLLHLSEKPAPAAFHADSYHIILSDTESEVSPLSFAQERQLNQPEFGYALLFASPASGLARVRNCLESFIPPELLPDRGGFLDMPAGVTTVDALQAWLAGALPNLEERERVVIHCRAGGTAEEMLARIHATADFARSRRARNRYIRFLHVVDPGATKAWVSLGRDIRAEIENQADAVVVARRWNAAGIRQLLAQKNKLNTDSVCQKIIERTGGWHLLVEEVLRSCGSHDDPTLTVTRLGLSLEDTAHPLRREFLAGFGFEGYPEAKSVLSWIAREGPVPRDLVIELNTSESTSKEQMENALTYLSLLDCIDTSDKGYSVCPVLGDLLR
jgi:hypothetical protein